MSFVFKQAYSFRATLYWQESQAILHRVGAGYDAGTPFKHNDGWLFAGYDDYTRYHGVVRSKAVIKMDFWFGCYVESGQYYYDVRCVPLSRQEPFYKGYQLDTSLNGYLGLYDRPSGLLEYAGSVLGTWQLGAINPETIGYGDFFDEVKLTSASGVAVQRLYDGGYPYLSDRGGNGKGTLAMEILEVAIPYPEEG